MVILGSTTLQLAFLFCLFSLGLGGWFQRSGDWRYFTTARRALLAAAALVGVSTVVLTQQLLASNFGLEYVARYSSAETPTMYKFAGLWAGMEGSLLFWAAILGLFILILNYQNRSANRSLMPIVNMVLGIILLFFLLVVNLFENPFTELPPGVLIQPRGMGLNPLLQHPAMLIHPPTLYLGYVGFAVPFAFAIAALVTRRLDATWIRTTRRWTLVPWMFLGIGIILGGRWAYVELGWGGYWAWDPVENASFLPWLTSTAYLHSVIIQEKKNMLRLWNVVLIMITFVLTIFGTYLTRSGILSSVHAFAASEMSRWFFGFMIFLILGCVILIVLRKEDLASRNRLESFTSRESGFLFNNMIFLALTLAILWGTMFPLLSEAVRGTQITVGSPYFDRITAPMGMILLLLTGVGPLLAWRRTSMGTVKRNFIIPIATAVAVMVIGLLMGFYSFYAVLTVGLSAFVAAGIIMEMGRAIRARRRSTGESALTAVRNIVDRNRSRYGGYIVHLGIIVMFIGFAGKAFTVEQDLTLNDGEQAQLGGYTFTMERHYTAERPNHFAKVIDLNVSRGDRFITVLKPEKRFYTDQNNQPNSEVAIYSRALRDLYAILGDVDLSSGTAVLKIMINPLVQLVWWGGIIMVAGTIVVLLPSAAERKLKAKLA